MNNVSRLAGLTILMLAAATALAADTGGDDFLKLADKLMNEAQRQHNVNSRMDAAVGGLNGLILDLKSNGLMQEGKADELQKIAQVLAMLSVEHVPNAAKFLEAAKARLAELKTTLNSKELSSAKKEIQTILAELQKLLTSANNFQAAEDLLTELRIIIQKQEQLKGDTTELGKQLVADPSADGKKDDISSHQNDLSKDTDRFRTHLKEAKDGAEDPTEKARLLTAFAAMEKMPIEATMVGAAKNVNEKKAIGALKQQDVVLADLHEIEKLLMSDKMLNELKELKELKQQLEDILKQQQEVRKETEKSELKEEQKKDLQAKQHDVEKKTEELEKKEKEVTPPEAQPPLEEARKEMEKAEKNIDEQKKKDAVEDQKNAEKKLQEAIDAVEKKIKEDEQQLDEQNDPEEKTPEEKELQQLEDLTKQQEQLEHDTQRAEKQNLPKLEKTEQEIAEKLPDTDKNKPLEEAKEEAKEAAKDLKNQKKEEALQHEQNALNKMREAVQQKKQELAKKKMKVEPKKPEEDPEKNTDREFTRKTPTKTGGPEDAENWKPMDQREREKLYQKYERELPAEYKELLEDYYEALSK